MTWIERFDKIERFIQQKWIPTYTKNFIHKQNIAKMFPIQNGRREEFETLLQDFLTIYNEEISIKRLELLKGEE